MITQVLGWVGKVLTLISLPNFHSGFPLHSLVSQLFKALQVINTIKAYISACGAIDKSVMLQMCTSFATCFGPSPFSEMMSELQHKHHAELELMYLDAAHYYNLYGPEQVPAFSSFNDPLCYAGSAPSVHYLKAMFVDWLAAHHVFIE